MSLSQDQIEYLQQSTRESALLTPDEIRRKYHYADAQWNPVEGRWEWFGELDAELTVSDEMKWMVPVLPWTLVKVRDEVEYERSVYRRIEGIS